MHQIRNDLATSLLLFITSSLALPQNTATTSATTTSPTPTSSSSTTTDNAALPSHTDNGDGGSSSNNSDNYDGMEHYYFVFLAVILICVLIAIFLIFRRKRRYAVRHRTGREYDALQRDVQRRPGGGASGQRHQRNHWSSRWRSTEDVGREEGLNEHGEAPPAYFPKGPEHSAEGAPAVPMQTLAREDVGLKPPDYSARAEESGQDASGSYPRQTEHRMGT